MDETLEQTEKRGKGKPRKFANGSEFESAFAQYLQQCEQRKDLPNISGFCVFCDMSKDVFYASEDYYPHEYKKVRDALEDRLQNYHHYQNNPAMAIMQGKNTFNWQDTPQVLVDNRQIKLDSNSDEIDKLLSKLGYLPSPER